MLLGKNVGSEKSVPLLADCFQKQFVLEGKTLDDEKEDLSRQTIYVGSLYVSCLCLRSCSGHFQ